MQKSSVINIYKIIILLIVNVLLFSCAANIHINLNPIEQVNYTIEYPNGKIYQMSAVCSEIMCRFILFDSLGMPVVDKEYSNNKFRNKKFLPPNNKYNHLFAYIINSRGSESKFEYKIDGTIVTVHKNE